MRASFLAALLAAAGCAAPRTEPQVPSIPVSPAPREAFEVDAQALNAEPETRRWKLKLDELFAAVDVLLPGGFPGVDIELRETREPATIVLHEAIRPLQRAVPLLKSYVAPRTWEDGRSALYAEGDEIVARHAPAVLAQTERVLETLKANRDRRVKVHVTFHSLPPDGLSLIENVPPVEGGLAGTYDRQKLAALASGWGQRWLNLTAPELTLRHGQAGSVQMVSQIAYVSGLAEQVTPGILDPVVGIDTNGFLMKARAIANGPESEDFLLDLSLEITSLADFVHLQLGAGTVELPGHTRSRVEGSFPLRQDQALLLALRGPGDALGLPLTVAIIQADWAKK